MQQGSQLSGPEVVTPKVAEAAQVLSFINDLRVGAQPFSDNLTFAPSPSSSVTPALTEQHAGACGEVRIVLPDLPQITLTLHAKNQTSLDHARAELSQFFQALGERVSPHATAPLLGTTPGELVDQARSASGVACDATLRTSRLDQTLARIAHDHAVDIETPWGVNNFAALARSYYQLALLKFVGPDSHQVQASMFPNSAERRLGVENPEVLAQHIVSSARSAVTLWYQYTIQTPKGEAALSTHDTNVCSLLAGSVGVMAGGDAPKEHEVVAGLVPLAQAVNYVRSANDHGEEKPQRYLLQIPANLVVESAKAEGGVIRLAGIELDEFLVNGVWNIAERPTSAQPGSSTLITTSQCCSAAVEETKQLLLDDYHMLPASKINSFHILGQLAAGLLTTTTKDIRTLLEGGVPELSKSTSASYVAELGCSSIPARVKSLQDWMGEILETAERNLPAAVISSIRAAKQGLREALDGYYAAHREVTEWTDSLKQQNKNLEFSRNVGLAVAGFSGAFSLSFPKVLQPFLDAGYLSQISAEAVGVASLLAGSAVAIASYWKRNWNKLMIKGAHDQPFHKRALRAFMPQEE